MVTHKVKPVWASEFNGVKCLESETEYGFFKSPEDHRPSSCRWVSKNKVKATTQRGLV